LTTRQFSHLLFAKPRQRSHWLHYHDKTPRLAFLKAQLHADIIDSALLCFRQRLDELWVDAHLDVFDVPGAFELPLLAQKMAETVVNGGIYRYDFVAQAVVTSLMEAGMKTSVPVLSVSLTPHHLQSTTEHQIFFAEHFIKKGPKATDAAIATLHT
jgi:6,7-dimethyl-8-ribityllumazine synthase